MRTTVSAPDRPGSRPTTPCRARQPSPTCRLRHVRDRHDCGPRRKLEVTRRGRGGEAGQFEARATRRGGPAGSRYLGQDATVCHAVGGGGPLVLPVGASDRLPGDGVLREGQRHAREVCGRDGLPTLDRRQCRGAVVDADDRRQCAGATHSGHRRAGGRRTRTRVAHIGPRPRVQQGAGASGAVGRGEGLLRRCLRQGDGLGSAS